MATNRLDAFRDDVFAVAITLLIFNVQVPHVGDAQVGAKLAEPDQTDALPSATHEPDSLGEGSETPILDYRVPNPAGSTQS
jgi:hypothetical protein